MDTQTILKEELEILKSDVIMRLKNAGQVATGKTIESFETIAAELNGQFLGASYVGVFERGRRPAGVPEDFIDILKRWASAKNISFSDEKQFTLWANAVKWKMIKEGTKLYRSGQNQDIFTTPIDQSANRFSKRLSAFYQNELVNEIFNF